MSDENEKTSGDEKYAGDAPTGGRCDGGPDKAEQARPKDFRNQSREYHFHQTSDGVDLTIKHVSKTAKRTTAAILTLYFDDSGDERRLVSIRHEITRHDKRAGSTDHETYHWAEDNPFSYSKTTRSSDAKGNSSSEDWGVPFEKAFQASAVVAALAMGDDGAFTKFLSNYLPPELGLKSV